MENISYGKIVLIGAGHVGSAILDSLLKRCRWKFRRGIYPIMKNVLGTGMRHPEHIGS